MFPQGLSGLHITTQMADTNELNGSSGEVEEVKVYTSFEEMELEEDLLRGIMSHGFEKPSKIQEKAIMPMKEGRDIIAQAQSGTGKTGAFVIGALSKVDPTVKKVQVLILVHVHELARQISKVASSIGQAMKINVLCATGGPPVRDDIKALEAGAQFVVGTPGRIYDLANRNALDRSQIKVLIMDEADQMLEDLFYKQVMCILEKGFPVTTQVALFSATMPEQVVAVADKILRNPVRILIAPSSVRLEGIQNFYVPLDRPDYKVDCVLDLYKNLSITQAVIFCNKRQTVDMLGSEMLKYGFPVTCIHGELDKNERLNKMKEFLTGKTRVMISTDMLARGIDVQQVSLVINFDIPTVRESYIHRTGRAGRFGRKGTTINLILPEEESIVKDISEHYGVSIVPLPEDLRNIL